MIVDILLVLLLIGGFVLGFFRGLIRQLLALGVWLIAFVGAAHLRVPLGDWLDASSTQFSTAYSYMLAFAIVYLIVFAAALVLVELGGAGSALTSHPLIDDAAGGALGLLVALLLVAGLVLALDSFFLPTPTPQAGEVSWLRDIHRDLGSSAVVEILREWLIRPLGVLLGPLLPAEIRALMA
ncbi:MAG TPA: CvpA family protein [Candidatus Limnocylindrales bacterium]